MANLPAFTPNNWQPGVGGTEVTAARLNAPETALAALLAYFRDTLVISSTRPVSPTLGTVWLQSGSAADSTPPTAPVLAVPTATATSVSLSWSGATDNVVVQSYEVWRQISGTWTKVNPDPVVGTTFTEQGLTPNTSYGPYKIIAVDSSQNRSGDSNTRTISTAISGDTQAPTVPTGVTVLAGDGSVTVSWPPSTDTVGVAGYHVWTNGANPITDAASPLLITGLTNDVSYTFQVSAFDAIPNESAKSTPAVSAVPKAAADVTKPTAPSSFAATAGNTLANLTWVASTDAGGSGLAKYRLYSNGSYSQDIPANVTSYQVTGLANGSLYAFELSGVDVAGNESNRSNAASVTPFGSSGISFTDDTTRANVVSGSIGNTALGMGWTNAGGSWAISSNTLIVNTASVAAMLGNSNQLNTDDFYIEAVYMGNAPLGSEIHLLGRAASDLTQFLGARFSFPSGGTNTQVILERLVTGGSLSTIGSAFVLPASLTVGDKIRFEGDGPGLTVKVNGSTVLTGTSSLVTTGKVFGLRARAAQNLALTTIKAGDL